MARDARNMGFTGAATMTLGPSPAMLPEPDMIDMRRLDPIRPISRRRELARPEAPELCTELRLEPPRRLRPEPSSCCAGGAA